MALPTTKLANSLLEKQMFLENENREEFQQRVKREIISLKKIGFVKDKHISDQRKLLEETLSFFDRMAEMSRSVGRDVTSKQLITELRKGMEDVGDRLRESLRMGSGATEEEDESEEDYGTDEEEDEMAVERSQKKTTAFASGTKKPTLEGSDSWRTRNHNNAAAINSGFRKADSFKKANSTVVELPDFRARGRTRAATMDLITQGRNASDDEISKMLKDVYISMCGSSNNADVNAKDNSTRDISLESFMTLQEFLKFVTMCNVIDEHLTMPKVEELFLTTVRSSSRGAKKFSRKIQFDDFVSAVAEMADIKFPYGGISGGGTAIDNMLTDYVWPMSARQKIKEALGSRRSSQFEMNWFKPDVMAFFNSQNEPLTKIFKRYSSISASSDSVMTISDRKDTHKQNMMLTQFCQFCIDYEVCPSLISQEDLMSSVRFIIGKKLSLKFTEFLQCIGKLAEEIHSDDSKFPNLQSKIEELFHDMDRSGAIFKLSNSRREREKARRTSTLGHMQMVGGKESNRRVSKMSQKRISNVNKMFMAGF